uniref:Uncharacterized protein n=1 Tax=Tetranychus urticae TaxID=32264 RepID=T1K321_TETUR
MPGLLKSPDKNSINQIPQVNPDAPNEPVVPIRRTFRRRPTIVFEDLEIIDVRMHSRPENASPMQLFFNSAPFPRVSVRRADGVSRKLG